MKKRILSFLLSLAMLVINASVFAQEEQLEYAQFFWDGAKNINIQGYYYSEGAGTAVYEQKENVSCLKLRGGGPYYCYINVSDSLFPSNTPVSVAITVRYYDEGENGEYFSLRYANPLDTFREPEKVEMTNTKEFKEHTFYIDDFVFANSNNGADVVLAGWTEKYSGSPGSTYIQWLKVEKSFPQKPVHYSLTSEHMGNVFDGNDEKNLNIVLNNSSSVEMITDAEYEVLTYDGKVIQSEKAEGVKIEAEKESIIPLVPDVNDYGTYSVRVRTKSRGIVDGEEKVFEGEEKVFDFSIANKKTENEKSNYMMRSQVHLDWGRNTEMLKMMAEMGISGSREAALWDVNERSKGVYSENWTMEKHFRYAKEVGLDQMLAMGYGNTVYEGNQVMHMPTTPEGIAAYAKYAARLAEKYGDVMQYFEVWNEPNLINFNSNYASATQYAELCKATYTEVKKANPNVKVGVWSTAQIPIGWIEETINAGILDYCDVVTIHPYDWEDTGMDNRIKNALYVKRIKELRELLTKSGKPDMPIVITEVGVRAGKGYASQIGQAAYLTQLFAVSAGEKNIDSIYIYDFMNDAPDDSRRGEGYWGLINHSAYTTPYSAKLSYVALAAYNKFVCDAEAVDNIVRNKTSVYRFKRNSDGKDVIILWSDNESESLGLNLGTNEIEIFDMYSNSKGKIQSADGKYSFEATFEPQYIVGNFSKMEETEAVIKIDNGRKYAAQNDTAEFNITDLQMRNLTVEAIAHDKAEIIESSDIKNGVGKIKVKLGSDAENENTVELRIFDGEKLLYTTKIHVCVTEPLEFNAHIEKYSDNSATRYIMSATVKNLSNTNSISGTVSSDFTEVGGEIETRCFENVKPGETINVQLNIPEQVVQRTIVSKANVELDYGYAQSKDIWLSKNLASYAKMPPKISGDFKYSDWMGGDWFAADDAYAARYLTGWKGVSDCSMTGTVKWDEENMYLLAIVEDDVFSNDYEPNGMWQGDGIQIAICSADERLKSSATFSEIGIGKLKGRNVMWRYETQTMYNNATSNLKSNVELETGESSVENLNGKYVYRARIPWTEFFGGDTKMDENTQLGFSVLLNDNDGNGRRGWVEYCSGIGMNKNPAQYGLMTLVK